jgi:hypothetical protein
MDVGAQFSTGLLAGTDAAPAQALPKRLDHSAAALVGLAFKGLHDLSAMVHMTVHHCGAPPSLRYALHRPYFA